MKLSKAKIWWLVVIGLLTFLILFIWATFNTLVSKEENIKTKWAQVENQYQRRADLIPNLVNIVKGYANHERKTLEAVILARSKATEITIQDNISPESIKKYAEVQNELSAALGKLWGVIENYPDLKANENFMLLQAQLEGAENRIAVERNNFNLSVKQYNVYLRRFPRNVIAPMLGFSRHSYYRADIGANQVPIVDFNDDDE